MQKILLVDDNPVSLQALDDALHAEFVEVTTIKAADGRAAVDASRDHAFVLCILDVQMPGMSGYELAEVLQSDARTRFVPIIFLTAGSPGSSDLTRGYEAGAVDYVVKEHDPFVLLSKVRVFLELDRQRRQLETLIAERASKDRLIEQQAKAIEIGQSEKLMALGRLMTSITHEVSQPLNAIRIICSDLQRQTRKGCLATTELETSMTDVCDQIDRMSRIVDHLRHYSRKVGDVEARAIEARAPLDGALKLLRHQMTTDQVEVALEIDEGARVLGDSLKLEQVFINLLGNACDAVRALRPQRRPRIEVTVRRVQQQEGDWVAFTIRDNGSGVPEELRERIFDPFYTGKERGEGTGLGLSVSKEIVEGHGGTITVRDSSDGGAAFEVVIPAPREAA